MSKTRFLVLEGPDKSGKSTQAALLAESLRARGLRVLHTREPGGTSFAEAVRSVLLDPRHTVCPLAELLLYEAARAQHTEEVIRPALARGEVVLSERYTLATLAYQAGGRGLPSSLVRSLNRIATSGLTPDLTLVLDMPDSEFGVRDPSRAHDRLEQESSAFRRKVRQAYLRLAKSEPHTLLVDSGRDKSAVQAEILEHALQALK